MRVLRVAGQCGLGDDPSRWLEGVRSGTWAPEAPEPERPRRVERDLWRRMGRLERLAVASASRALAGREGEGRLGVVWGSCVGSLPASRVYMRSLAASGPESASPAAFQVSVHNAAAGFIALALGLTGPAESVFAGGATGLVALLTAQDLLTSGCVDEVLVVVGDARSRDALLAHRLSGLPEPGDAVCALLLDAQEGAGPRVGLCPPSARPTLARRLPLVGEHAPEGLQPALAPETSLGLVPAVGLWCVGALASREGGEVVDWCGGMRLGAEVRCSC